ncbi:TPA: DUF2554 family protein, partial [Salmonella enterica subsp. enterica serovar Infantis]|nr:DUF2554 family protein [Salmonella enterica subsp. enterica serovar Infantis]
MMLTKTLSVVLLTCALF